ncbi:MAG: hypothetical protein U0228_35960 [Myxococcaceae bacterium]
MIRTRSTFVVVAAAVFAVAMVGCEMKVEPELVLTLTPKTIDGLGQTSTVRATAANDMAKAGTGKVRFSSPAGSLKTPVEVDLASGEASTTFSCAVAADPACTGSVKITAEWVVSGKLVTASSSVTITPVVVDAGTDAGFDAGSDAGTDAGSDAGSDAGMDSGIVVTTDGGYVLTATSSKQNLVANSLDFADVQLHLVDMNAMGVAAQVSLALTGGASFSSTAATPATMVMTDASGNATVQVFAGTALGAFNLTGSAMGAGFTLPLRATNVNSINWKSDTTTASALNVQNAGIGTATSVFFEVRDSSNLPVPGIEVVFGLAANAAAGCSVAPARAITDMMGVVRTTLSSGSSSGLATVTASVVGLPLASSPAFNIRWGLPYHERLQLTCDRKTLGALETTNPPRTDQNTNCQITLQDRDGNAPNYPVTVNWKSEVGSINGTTSMANAQIAVAQFQSGGGLPAPTVPLAGEPNNGGANPRDGFVTVIASVTGEETFYDGSGTSNGFTNGKWDPGEYFIDLGEPFVDANDNGVLDVGEPFTDTDRYDCTTGTLLPKNMVWDGPNGCWDKKTQIWATTHIVYAGALPGGAQNTMYVTVTPPFPPSIGISPASSTHNVVMTDSNFNRLSSDNIMASIVTISGMRGTATITTAPSGGESFGGHSVLYTTIKATETSPGVFRDDGPCDYQTGRDAGYPATRCLPAVRFNGWLSSPTSLSITINGATVQTALADGGAAPPTTTNFELRIQNSLQAGSSVVPWAVSFQ